VLKMLSKMLSGLILLDVKSNIKRANSTN
jgi:hypothetical protein